MRASAPALFFHRADGKVFSREADLAVAVEARGHAGGFARVVSDGIASFAAGGDGALCASYGRSACGRSAWRLAGGGGAPCKRELLFPTPLIEDFATIANVSATGSTTGVLRDAPGTVAGCLV
jgi:hypothetical protein